MGSPIGSAFDRTSPGLGSAAVTALSGLTFGSLITGQEAEWMRAEL